MNNLPILVLQLHRMGDVLLSFPLLDSLQKLYPEHPIYLVGEQRFLEPLLPFMQNLSLFSYDDITSFNRKKFFLVFNLSFREEAAKIAAQVKAEKIFGPFYDEGLYVSGDWHLYRMSLTHNNRHNLYHWGQLNFLDLIPEHSSFSSFVHAGHATLAQTRSHRTMNELVQSGKKGKIAFFIGASQQEKHPDSSFWIRLLKLCLLEGYKPVLLGGKDEYLMGWEIAEHFKLPALNLCGRFDLKELALFLSEVDLLVVPDTGPMHLAAHIGVPVLNLALGNVNSWETGPFAYKQHVLRVRASCIGCWSCYRKEQICKSLLSADDVFPYIKSIIEPNIELEPMQEGPLELLQTGCDDQGFYHLFLQSEDSCAGNFQNAARSFSSGCFTKQNNGSKDGRLHRLVISFFWKEWFACAFGLHSYQRLSGVLNVLSNVSEEATNLLGKQSRAFVEKVLMMQKSESHLIHTFQSEWNTFHSSVLPLSGYLQLYLQNQKNSTVRRLYMLENLEKLYALFSS